MVETDEVKIAVVQVEGGYEIKTTVNGKPWLRHGPFQTLDVANQVCREMLDVARRIRNRFVH